MNGAKWLHCSVICKNNHFIQIFNYGKRITNFLFWTKFGQSTHLEEICIESIMSSSFVRSFFVFFCLLWMHFHSLFDDIVWPKILNYSNQPIVNCFSFDSFSKGLWPGTGSLQPLNRFKVAKQKTKKLKTNEGLNEMLKFYFYSTT
jgi:hypothetical protein